jgi:hypothetical protein
MNGSILALTVVAVVNTGLLLAVIVLRPRPSKAVPAPLPPPHPEIAMPQFSAEMREKLEQAAATAFTAAVEQATTRFGQDLSGTSEHLNKLIVNLTTQVVEHELEQYHKGLDDARTQAISGMAGMQQAIEQREQVGQAAIDAELAKRRAFLLERIDRKLGQAVAAYIVDTLGQGVDLGAQRGYLIDSLEAHKAELKKDFSDDV